MKNPKVLKVKDETQLFTGQFELLLKLDEKKAKKVQDALNTLNEYKSLLDDEFFKVRKYSYEDSSYHTTEFFVEKNNLRIVLKDGMVG